jgi:hypothetical protein
MVLIYKVKGYSSVAQLLFAFLIIVSFADGPQGKTISTGKIKKSMQQSMKDKLNRKSV